MSDTRERGRDARKGRKVNRDTGEGIERGT